MANSPETIAMTKAIGCKTPVTMSSQLAVVTVTDVVAAKSPAVDPLICII